MVDGEECLLRQECPLWVTSRHLQRKSMSALPPKADMCSALSGVRHLPLELDAVRALSGHGFHPSKAQHTLSNH
jgi:hypothetical protein